LGLAAVHPTIKIKTRSARDKNIPFRIMGKSPFCEWNKRLKKAGSLNSIIKQNEKTVKDVSPLKIGGDIRKDRKEVV
jgi:hypothetical protein